MGVYPPTSGLSLCAGGGGLDMGLMLAEPGFHTRCFVEWEEYPRQAIIAAQRAGYFAPAPIWDDVTTFDGRPFRGAFDTILAGYPCQPFSHAGQRRGADDERHLWPDVARIIREVEPEWVFLENVAGHVSLGAETVLRELWDMGWTPAAGLFSASEIGAPHERLRWFCVAHRRQERHEGREWQRQQHGVGAQSGDEGRIDMADAERGTAERRGHELAEASGDLQGEAREQWLRTDARDGSDRMAHPDGRHSGAERQQRGGQLGFQPEGGGTGAGDVVHAECSERRSDATDRHIPDRDDAGRNQAAGRAGKSDAAMDHPASPRCDDARERAGSDSEGRERMPGTGCGAMADASGAKRQGQQPGQRDAGGWQEPHGHSALPGGTGLFPPGPGDTDAWAAVLRSAPDMAPAAAARDLHAWARRLEADGREWWQAQAESALCRMVDGLASRSRALRLLGNGVHPLAAGYAWRTLAAAHGLRPVDLEAASAGGEGATDDLTVRAAE